MDIEPQTNFVDACMGFERIKERQAIDTYGLDEQIVLTCSYTERSTENLADRAWSG